MPNGKKTNQTKPMQHSTTTNKPNQTDQPTKTHTHTQTYIQTNKPKMQNSGALRHLRKTMLEDIRFNTVAEKMLEDVCSGLSLGTELGYPLKYKTGELGIYDSGFLVSFVYSIENIHQKTISQCTEKG